MIDGRSDVGGVVWDDWLVVVAAKVAVMVEENDDDVLTMTVDDGLIQSQHSFVFFLSLQLGQHHRGAHGMIHTFHP
jgi:hypothetical protein